MSHSLSSTNVQEQEGMQNPFEFSEDKILDDVYRTHFDCFEKCDVTSLQTVASNVINHSIDISEKVISKGDQLREQFSEEINISSQQLTAKLRRIAYLMICTPRGEHFGHRTTMLILEQLKHYSWDAKVLIVQAAFSLEYGKIMYLPLTTQCQQQIENLFADLNGLLMVPQNTQHLPYFNSVVKKAMQMIECIIEWKRLISLGHDIKDVPTLAETFHQIPVVVYWAIFTFVSCTGQIDEFTDYKVQRHELSKSFEPKLDSILGKFKEFLERCSKEIVRIEDYTRREKIVIHTGKNIVKVLKALIISRENRDLRQNVFNVLTGEQVKIEEFKKYVLLFISGLDKIEDEIRLLKSIHEKLKEKPREVEGYRSEDFKILWIPIVDEWNEERRKKLESHLQCNKFGWYVVKYFNFETGMKLIKEVFKYKEKPIIALINPQGKVENIDTKQIISVWGIDGFPFRTSDHYRLTQQWNWFWSEMTKLNQGIESLIEEDCYLFIYGGMDTKWIQEFATAIETLKRDVAKLKLNINTTIESYQLGKDDPKAIPHFWIAIDSLLTRRKQMKKGIDFATSEEIKRLLFLKQDPKGWTILSKGHNVKLLGHGEAMCRTVKDFGMWHGKLHEEVSFDVAFREYYEEIMKDNKDCSKKCLNVISAGYAMDILERIVCPKKDCRRPMEVASVSYKCCHDRKK
ncbi:hypothetical protein AAZX31_20G046800 [Glycine max]|uniref:Sieve element occlusion o n=2 Tax=Glycine max TaxID=3847 RepID=E2FKI6_SOYBN|nr:sieve element occlusion o [Glycine max]ADN32798.1 sieve element occlusion o [Glycine max]KAG4394521.1 hypothetical protein GLYMA_20G053000v4 [Glycine max]KAG5076702.1 hypothetical protein JHK82_055397 [Glycine max]KAH1034647.1 hypothetical protein GYH30_054872 [Glycine max]KAH1189402.1 Protein SIEVE ELEMENT OCCLUSION B [Glycine max]|eukprot:NP_001242108.1 sieve element occlusion o [Glycine max]